MGDFRSEYRVLTEGEKQLIGDIKEKAKELHTLMNSANYEYLIPGTDKLGSMAVRRDERSTQVADTRLEEAVMWAIKAITK